MAKTSIHLESDTRDELRARKKGNETYDDVISRLLEQSEHRLAGAEPKTQPNE